MINNYTSLGIVSLTAIEARKLNKTNGIHVSSIDNKPYINHTDVPQFFEVRVYHPELKPVVEKFVKSKVKWSTNE